MFDLFTTLITCRFWSNTLLGIVVVLAGCSTDPAPVPPSAGSLPLDAHMRDLVTHIGDVNSGDSTSFHCSNYLVVQSPAILRVVAEGPAIVPLLVVTMEQPNVDFDIFTRCYTACDQIRPEANIHWSGGAFSAINVDGVIRFRDTRLYLDLEGFKKSVIAEVRAAFNLPTPSGPAPTVQGPQ